MGKRPKPQASPETEAVVVEAEKQKTSDPKPWLFKAGQPSANPGGRPKGLAAAIREKYPPEKLRDAFIAIADAPRTSARDRMEALRWLSDHGYGKAPETHLVGALTEDQRDAAAELTREQLLGLIEAGPVPALPSGVEVKPAVEASQVIVDAEVIQD